jgi:hypothetical protein
MNPDQDTPTDSGVQSNEHASVPPPSGPQIIGPQQTPASPSAPQPDVQPSQSGFVGLSMPGQQPLDPQSAAPATFGSGVQSSGVPAIPPGQVPKKHRVSKKLLVVFSAVLLLGVGGGAFAYIQIMSNSPEKVLADALTHTMADVLDRKSTQLTGAIKFTSKDASTPYSVLVDIDSKQVNDNSQLTAKVQVKMAEKLDVTVNASAVVEGTDALYIKLDKLQQTVDQIVVAAPDAAEGAHMVQPLIKKIDGKWIKIDKQSLAEFGVPTEDTIDKCSEELGKLRISKSDQKRVKEIFLNNQFAIASEELPGEAVDGDKSYHYKLDLNEEAAIKFTKEFIEIESFSGVKAACKIDQKGLDQDLKDLKKQSDEEIQGNPVFELWVSQKTRRPTKVKLAFDDKEASMENIATIKLNAENLHVDVPTDVITLQQLRSDIQDTFSAAQTLGWSDFRTNRQ